MAKGQVREVLIFSTTEGKRYANALQANLAGADGVSILPTVWSQNVFKVGQVHIDALILGISKTDFVVVIATPDDITKSRGRSSPSPRDNLVLEIGLAMGIISRRRTFLVQPRNVKQKIPSNLLGVIAAEFVAIKGGNPQALLGPAATQISGRIKDIGPRVRVVKKKGQARKVVKRPSGRTPSGGFLVEKAEYGAGQTWADVTVEVRKHEKDGKLEMKVENEELGGDPVPGVRKTLKVSYRNPSGGVSIVTVAEHEVVKLPP